MKKIIFKSISMLLVAGLFLGNAALADVLPDDAKLMPVCAEITGINTNTSYIFYARESGPTMASPRVWEVKEGECVDVNYKFNSIQLYAVPKGAAATADPENNLNASKPELPVYVADEYVPPSSKLTYRHNKYAVTSVDPNKHIIHLVSKGFVTNLSKGAAAEFIDIPTNGVYFDASVYLKNTGIIAGYSNGKFMTYNHINRAEFTQIIANVVNAYPFRYSLCRENYLNPNGSYDNIFKDVLIQDDAWFTDAVCFAKQLHLIDGYPDGTFQPANEISYAEAATILVHAFNIPYAKPTAHALWYRTYLNALATLKVVPSTITSPDQKITRGEMIRLIYSIQQKNGDYPSAQ